MKRGMKGRFLVFAVILALFFIPKSNAAVLWSENFNEFSADWSQNDLQDGRPNCPSGYDYCAADTQGDYGSPDIEITTAAERSDPDGNNRGFRLHIWRDSGGTCCENGITDASLWPGQTNFYLRTYLRLDFNSQTSYAKLFRIKDSSNTQRFILDLYNKYGYGGTVFTLGSSADGFGNDYPNTNYKLENDYTPNTWISVELFIDQTNHQWTLWVDGVQQGSPVSIPTSNYVITGTMIGGNQVGQGTVDHIIDYDDLAVGDSYIGPAGGGDTTPPAISGVSPTGTLPFGTSQATLSLATDETATCRYSTTPGTAYSSMTGTFTGSTSHSATVSVSDGNTYNYYVRCQDQAGNTNPGDYPISFNVAQAGIPAISSVSGDISNGQTVTISGSGFGATGPDVILFDDFDTGANGQNLASSPQIGSWDRNDAPYATYSNSQHHSGTQSAQAVHTPSLSWSNFNVEFSSPSTLYGSFWFRVSSFGGGGQYKLNQVHGDCNCGDFAPGVMTGDMGAGWWKTYISYEDGSTSDQYSANYPNSPSANAWHHFEWIGRQSSGGVSDGSVKIYIDGIKVTPSFMDSVKTRNSAGNSWYLFEFFTGLTNMASSVTTWIDDAYLSASWARIEICNANTNSGSSHCEIQIPSSWSSDSITVTVNQGSFTSGQTAYLYVVDSTGSVNADGYPITLGAGVGPVCGNGNCESGETPAGCPADCTSSCTSGADSDGDSVVSNLELTGFISDWKSGSVAIGELIAAVNDWKNGC